MTEEGSPRSRRAVFVRSWAERLCEGSNQTHMVDLGYKQVWVTEFSLHCLSYDARFRRVAIQIVESPKLEWLILAVISCNSILLLITLPDVEIEKQTWAQVLDYTALAIYVVECLTKIVAAGFLFGRGTYIKNPWNVLDFIVVLSGIAEVVLQSIDTNLSALRCFRLLRPLKTLNVLPGTRCIVQTLFASVPQLRVLLGLAMFVLGILAGLGLHLFNDSSWKRCRDGNNVIVSDRLCGGSHICPVNSTCVNSANWPPTAIGQLWDQPEVDYGITGFGNFLQAIMTVFQCSTQEGWTDQMYRIMDSTSGVLSVIFFITTLVLGAFFVFNLILAVLWQQYEANAADKDADGFLDANDEEIQWKEAEEEAQVEKEIEGTRATVYSWVEGQNKKMSVRQMEDMNASIIHKSNNQRLKRLSQRPEVEEEFIKLCETLAELVRLCTNFEIVIKQLDIARDTSSLESAGGVVGQLHYQRARLRRLAMSSRFTNTMMGVIILNAIVLALDRYPAWKEAEDFMTDLNIAFTFMFTLEVAVKLAGLGVVDFSKNASDMFDFIITVLAIMELWLSDHAAGLSALRTLRLLRVFKLARGWTSLRILLQVLAKATVMMGHFCFVSFLVFYIFTLVGLQLFGRGQLGSPTTRPRLHFDNGLWSFATVFCIITGENWNTIMFETAYLSQKFTLTCIFVLLVVVIGNLVLLNLFLAILGASFQNAREVVQNQYRHRLNALLAVCPSDIMHEQLSILRKQSDETDTLVDEAERINDAVKKKLHAESCVGELGPWSSRIIMHPNFDNFILCMIFATSVSLALDSPNLDPDSALAGVLSAIDIVITLIFLFEAMIKLTAMGMAQYFSIGWNWIDFFLVMLSILNFFLWMLSFEAGSGLKALKSVRALRTLRPLRLIARNKGLKVVVNCLLSSIPQIVNTLVVTFLLFTIFAILSVNFFKGILYYCDIDPALLELIDTKADCLQHGGQWVNSDSHFDNVFASFYTLFQASTTEGWTDIMTSVVDGRGIDLQPKRDFNQWAVVFFLVWMLVGGFFILNLFFGVIIDQYHVAKGETEGGVLITKEQKRWIEVQKLVLKHVPLMSRPTGQGSCRKSLLSIVESNAFVNTIYTLITINTVLALLRHAGQTDGLWLFLEVTQTTFGLLFTIEAILKIIAFGPNGYFMFGGNRFDFFLVTSTLLVIAATLAGLGDSYVVTVLRSFRVIRSVRLLHKLPQLRVMFVVAITVFPSIANVCGLVLLLTFMYACLGVNLFGMIYRDQDTALSDFANFESFPLSVLLLLRVSTGEAWYMLMFDCAKNHPNCVEYQSYNDFMKDGGRTCGTIIAYPFFISYTLIVAFVVVNLFVGCVLDAFLEQHQDDVFRLIREEHQFFFELWAKTHPCGRRLMRWEYFIQLLLEIPMPVGFKNAFPNGMSMSAKTSRVRKFLLNSDMPTWKGQVHLRDCMILICSRCCAYISLEEKSDLIDMPRMDLSDNEVTRTFRARFPEFYPPHHPKHHTSILVRLNEEPITADSSLQQELAFRVIAQWQRTKWRKLRGKMLHASDFAQMRATEKESVEVTGRTSRRGSQSRDLCLGELRGNALTIRGVVQALAIATGGNAMASDPVKDVKSRRASDPNINNNNADGAMSMQKTDELPQDAVRTAERTKSEGAIEEKEEEDEGDLAATMMSEAAFVAKQFGGLPIIDAQQFELLETSKPNDIVAKGEDFRSGSIPGKEQTASSTSAIIADGVRSQGSTPFSEGASLPGTRDSSDDDIAFSGRSSTLLSGMLSDDSLDEVVLQMVAELEHTDESSDGDRPASVQEEESDILASLFSLPLGSNVASRSDASSVFVSVASSEVSAHTSATASSVPLTPIKHDSENTSTYSSALHSSPTDLTSRTEELYDDQVSKISSSVVLWVDELRSDNEGASELPARHENVTQEATRLGGDWPPLDDDVLDIDPATNGKSVSIRKNAERNIAPSMPSTESAPRVLPGEAPVIATGGAKRRRAPKARVGGGGRGQTDGDSTSTASKLKEKRRPGRKKMRVMHKRATKKGPAVEDEDEGLEEEDTDRRDTYATTDSSPVHDLNADTADAPPPFSYSSFSPCYSPPARAAGNPVAPLAHATTDTSVPPRSVPSPSSSHARALRPDGQRVDKGARQGTHRPLRLLPVMPESTAARGKGGKVDAYSCPDCQRQLPSHTSVPCGICQAKPSHVCTCGFTGCRFCLKAITEKRYLHLPRWVAERYEKSP
eukprot:GEMP01000372.1.p1 GENE.GEMP01000372.1~~GEMP01000372.1.p1  ORF type:complete len:2224 (+),score=490.20 GEMP01000372.1:55-6726(+)